MARPSLELTRYGDFLRYSRAALTTRPGRPSKLKDDEIQCFYLFIDACVPFFFSVKSELKNQSCAVKISVAIQKYIIIIKVNSRI